MEQTVIAIFNREEEARKAVRELAGLGFTDADVDITSNGAGNLLQDRDSTLQRSRDNSANEDDTFGEKVSKFFRGMFDDEDESNAYSTAAKNRSIVTVQAHSTEDAIAVSRILDEAGAIDINEGAMSDTGSNKTPVRRELGDNTSNFNQDMNIAQDRASDFNLNPDLDADIAAELEANNNSNTNSIDNSNSNSIPVIEEELHVGKREVQTGGVRVRSRIIEKPIEQTLRLREETVNVVRTPVDRVATEKDLSSFQEGEIEITETAEVPVVSKQARVVEEIHVDKNVEEREEVIHDSVKKTDVEIEETGTEKKRKRRS